MANRAYETIRLPIDDRGLLAGRMPSRAAVRRLAERIEEGLAAAFPGAEITVDVRRRSTGAAYAPTVYPDPDPEDVAQVLAIADAARHAWSAELTEGDVET